MWVQEASHNVQSRRLPAARRAEQPEEFAAPDLERGLVYGPGLPELLAHVLDLEERPGRAHRTAGRRCRVVDPATRLVQYRHLLRFPPLRSGPSRRSEEHTSALQSLMRTSYPV